MSLLESGFFILSFKYLSLASAHSIQAFTPLIVIVLAFVFLKEKIDTKTWIVVACGFIGVIIILIGVFISVSLNANFISDTIYKNKLVQIYHDNTILFRTLYAIGAYYFKDIMITFNIKI